MTWICGKLFSAPVVETKKRFCGWCHSTNCTFTNYMDCCKDKNTFKCQYHDKNKSNPPSFCHSCSYGWHSPDTWTKPTIYKSDLNNDTVLCTDWICETCDKREKDRKDLEERKYNNTAEAARLVFTEKDGAFFFEGRESVEADFPLSYESLAPYVTKAIDGADSFLNYGIDFEAIIIRDGRVYTRDYRQEWEVTWEKEDV